MIEAYFRDYGVRIIHGWGMTETTHGATISFARETCRTMPRWLRCARRASRCLATKCASSTMTEKPVPRDGVTPGHLQCRGHWIAGAYFRRPEVD